MIQLFLNNHLVQVKSDATIKLTVENPYYKSGSSYTFDIELPLGIPINKSFFGHIDRIDVGKQIKEYSARLMADNRNLIVGTAVVTEVSESAVKVQLLGKAAAYNFHNKMDETYIDELELGDFASDMWPEKHKRGELPGAGAHWFWSNSDKPDISLFNGSRGFVMFPVYNETADCYVNDWVYTCDTYKGTDFYLGYNRRAWARDEYNVDNQKEIPYLTAQPMLWMIVKRIAEATGKKIDDANNIFLQDEFLKRIFIPAASGFNEYKYHLPHWTVNEFWSELEKAFGVIVYLPENSDSISMIGRASFYSETVGRTVIKEVVDEFTVDIDDDTSTDVSVSNVGFESFSADPEDLLSDDVTDSATVRTDFDDLESIKKYVENLKEPERSNWLYGQRGTLFKCKDGRQYIYFLTTYDVPQFREVDQFRDRINDRKKDVEMTLKFVPCKFIEHDMRILERVSEGTGQTKFVTGYGNVRILSRPDRSDTEKIYDAYKRIDEVILEDIILGEEGTEKPTTEDIIYMALLPNNGYGGTVKADKLIDQSSNFYIEKPYPVPVLRSKTMWKVQTDSIDLSQYSPFSLSLNRIDNQKNLYSETLKGVPVVNTRIKECIKFVSATLPDPSDIFLIRNKTFLCEKLEADLKADGMDKIVTGYFYRTEL